MKAQTPLKKTFLKKIQLSTFKLMMIIFWEMKWPMKSIKPYFQLGPLPEIFTIADLWNPASKVYSCTEPQFRLCRMKLCSNVKHCPMVLHYMKPQRQVRWYQDLTLKIRKFLQAILEKNFGQKRKTDKLTNRWRVVQRT